MTYKRILILAFLSCGLVRPAHAFTISNVTFSDTNITYETGGIPNGTTVTFTIDSPGLVQIAVNCGIQNLGDTGTNVATLSQTYSGASTNQLFWNGLWLIGGEPARNATSCDFTLTLTTGSSSTSVSPGTLVTLNSVDIHNIAVASSVDASGASSPPYGIAYALAKASNVTLTILNSSGTIVRTLLNNVAQAGEATIAPHTLLWDGLKENGQPVSLGVYSVRVTATDPAVSGSSAIPRTRPITVQSLAGAASDPQKLFEDNIYVFPNPVRNGIGTFKMEAVRDGASISLKIYTIDGTLVLQQTFPGLTAGTVVTYPWTVTNQSGNKVGRGLYYYVVREEDSTGTLQTVKKMAVLP